ncbi:hypothetical protein [Desulfotruncus alcoholivorax]|uniref:hypothetical protein n=1 Tax=Desulfotruncus alcoholivorax TaxID=265477 RepID=UPI0004841BA2|nr:hypothetical protein [Desulfotruncus alcoholivorax]
MRSTNPEGQGGRGEAPLPSEAKVPPKAGAPPRVRANDSELRTIGGGTAPTPTGNAARRSLPVGEILQQRGLKCTSASKNGYEESTRSEAGGCTSR